ncbi:MAG: PhoX family phosphatase [Rhodospirillaceae bacterium]|nr:PhoX family phosphatase [Rhodospirillaceae bacterium]
MTQAPKATRRETLKLAGAGLAAASMAEAAPAASNSPSTLTFPEVDRTLTDTHHVAEGFKAQVLLRWGDPLFGDAPAFDPLAQTADAQKKQFGYDCDFIGFMPLPKGSRSSTSGLLCVNHELARSKLMFPGTPKQLDPNRNKEMADIEMASQGHTVIEVALRDGTWEVNRNSKYNRRVSGFDTVIELTGPVAGHARVKTKDDPTGRKVIGTFANCAGGETPWGTVLIGEENIEHHFGGDPRGTSEEANHAAMGLTENVYYNWNKYYPRFDMSVEPHEPNRFGWMVEIDPYDPTSTPKKRTALGRFKHEGAGFAFAPDKRVVVYSGDDEVFQFIYRYVSRNPWKPGDDKNNRALLDDGTLYVAQFDAKGAITWLPLVWGEGALTPANGFNDQGDVLIETRRAAKLLGATPMDRPEEIVPNPVTGTVFVSLTKNSKRKDTDFANPRAKNKFGQIHELLPPGHDQGKPDHAALRFQSRPFILAGNPADPDSGAQYHADLSTRGWFTNPDNMTFDAQGRIWLSTDGGTDFGYADGLWAADVTGPGRALSRAFFTGPRGSELTGPCFTPNGASLFCSVQHPADDDGSTFDTPSTRWPDFDPALPPRPSVVVITRSDGSLIS